MAEDERGAAAAAPHGVLMAVAVVGVVVAVPYFLGDGGEAVTEAFADALSPVGLLLLPVGLVLLIHFLSSDRGSALSSLFSAGSPDSIHRAGGSPVGVALVLVILVVLLYYRVSIFGGGDDDE